MARVKLILKSGDVEMRFPVTPASISMSFGRQVVVYDLIGIGEHTEYAGKTAEEYQLADLLIPGEELPFAFASTIGSDDPQAYIKQLRQWRDDKSAVRLITSGSPLQLNVQTYITSVQPVHRGAGKNLYLTIALKDHEALKKHTESSGSASGGASDSGKRESKSTGTGTQTYTVKKGDTLWAICKKYYSNGTLAYKLAAYNGIKNANYIQVGQKIKIPEKGKL